MIPMIVRRVEVLAIGVESTAKGKEVALLNPRCCSSSQALVLS